LELIRFGANEANEDICMNMLEEIKVSEKTTAITTTTTTSID